MLIEYVNNEAHNMKIVSLFSLEKEWEEVNCERLGDILTQAKQMVKEANSLLETFDEEIVFRVVLAVPRSLLSSQQTPDVNTSDEVLVRVLHRRKGSESVWSVNTLQEKLVILRDIAKRKEGGAQVVSAYNSIYIAIYVHAHAVMNLHSNHNYITRS